MLCINTKRSLGDVTWRDLVGTWRLIRDWSYLPTFRHIRRDFAKEPIFIGLFCGKCPIKRRHPMDFRHPVQRFSTTSTRNVLSGTVACRHECVNSFFLTIMRQWYWFLCDWYQVINDESHENPDTPGTKLKVFRNNLKMLCHPIGKWLHWVLRN